MLRGQERSTGSPVATGGFEAAPASRSVPARLAGGPVSRTPLRETGSGGAIGSVAGVTVLAVALCVAICPAALSVSEGPSVTQDEAYAGRAGPGVLAAPAVLAASMAFSDSQQSFPVLLAEGPAPVLKSTGAGPVVGAAGHDATRAALETVILRLEGEIAELDRLAEWQARLLAAARTDPDGARRQRRTRSSCFKTPLAAWCDRLNGMYREEDGGRPAGESAQ